MENRISNVNYDQNISRNKLDISLDNSHHYLNYYQNGRNLRNILKNKYYLNTPKITSKSYVDSSLMYTSYHPKKDSLVNLYTENDINQAYNIIQNLKYTLKDTERIKQKFLGNNKSYNGKKHLVPEKKRKSIMISPIYSNKYDESMSYDNDYNYDISNGNSNSYSNDNEIEMNMNAEKKRKRTTSKNNIKRTNKRSLLHISKRNRFIYFIIYINNI